MNDFCQATVSRHARALRILTYLQSGPCYNAKKLADNLRVSRRTIHRDLSLIRQAGIHVSYDGRDSAYRLASASARYLPPPTFAVEELMALVLAAHLSLVQAIPDMAVTVNLCIAKLLSAYPGDVRTSISRLLNAAVLRLSAAPAADHLPQMMQQLLTAVTRQQHVRCILRDDETGQIVQTLVAPYRLVMTERAWVLVGRSSLHRCTRAFDIPSIQQMELTDESFEVPAGFHHREPLESLSQRSVAI